MDIQNSFEAFDRDFNELCDQISDHRLKALALRYRQPLLIIQSACRQTMTGFGFVNWLSLANHAITYYGPYWLFIASAFQVFGIMDIVRETDHKGTFRRKEDYFFKNFPIQDDGIEPLINILFGPLGR